VAGPPSAPIDYHTQGGAPHDRSGGTYQQRERPQALPPPATRPSPFKLK
jgi:hypothetical protein